MRRHYAGRTEGLCKWPFRFLRGLFSQSDDPTEGGNVREFFRPVFAERKIDISAVTALMPLKAAEFFVNARIWKSGFGIMRIYPGYLRFFHGGRGMKNLERLGFLSGNERNPKSEGRQERFDIPARHYWHENSIPVVFHSERDYVRKKYVC